MSNLRIYVDASGKWLTVGAIQHTNGRTAYVYDAAGKRVLVKVLDANALSVEQLPPGTYTIVIHCDKCVTLTGRFVKQ